MSIARRFTGTAEVGADQARIVSFLRRQLTISSLDFPFSRGSAPWDRDKGLKPCTSRKLMALNKARR